MVIEIRFVFLYYAAGEEDRAEERNKYSNPLCYLVREDNISMDESGLWKYKLKADVVH